MLIQLTEQELALVADMIATRREELNRTVEQLLEDVQLADKVLAKLHQAAGHMTGMDSLCPNCGKVGYHDAPEECGR